MKRILILSFVMFWSLGGMVLAQDQRLSFGPSVLIKPGIGFEYLTRTIKDKDSDSEFSMKSYSLGIASVFETQGGFIFNAYIGYTFSNFDAMTFRRLPISVQLEVGDTGGFLFGVGGRKDIIRTGSLALGLDARFNSFLGSKKTWPIPGLSVEGQVSGKPVWHRLQIGPMFTYTGFSYFFPYIKVGYERFWGKYKVEETIQTLSDIEEKSFEGKASIFTALGAVYEMTSRLTIEAEMMVLPHSSFSEIDFGFMFRFTFEL